MRVCSVGLECVADVLGHGEHVLFGRCELVLVAVVTCRVVGERSYGETNTHLSKVGEDVLAGEGGAGHDSTFLVGVSLYALPVSRFTPLGMYRRPYTSESARGQRPRVPFRIDYPVYIASRIRRLRNQARDTPCSLRHRRTK